MNAKEKHAADAKAELALVEDEVAVGEVVPSLAELEAQLEPLMNEVAEAEQMYQGLTGASR